MTATTQSQMPGEPQVMVPSAKQAPDLLFAPKPQLPYHVVLINDNDHTYDYVIEMLGRLFGHSTEQALAMAREVDSSGRVIADTTSLERAELKRDQIHAFGRDWRIERCSGSMQAVIEPA